MTVIPIVVGALELFPKNRKENTAQLKSAKIQGTYDTFPDFFRMKL